MRNATATETVSAFSALRSVLLRRIRTPTAIALQYQAEALVTLALGDQYLATLVTVDSPPEGGVRVN